jgi:hypothetical protein
LGFQLDLPHRVTTGKLFGFSISCFQVHKRPYIASPTSFSFKENHYRIKAFVAFVLKHGVLYRLFDSTRFGRASKAGQSRATLAAPMCVLPARGPRSLTPLLNRQQLPL